MSDHRTITIPVPTVAPLGWEVTDPHVVQEVWDVYIKPNQEAGNPQSGEERVLMAILRAVAEGLARREPTPEPPARINPDAMKPERHA